MTTDFTKTLVKHILENPQPYEWQVQGFGMLRIYLPDDTRLHIWDDSLKVPGVSLIHDHPWDFLSLIVVGELINTRYLELAPNYGIPHMVRTIKPGVGLKVIDEDVPCSLTQRGVEHYTAGHRYFQSKEEVHSTNAVNGTVTIVRRSRGPVDVAKVFYPKGEQWVSAEPRLPTNGEVERVTKHALETWFK